MVSIWINTNILRTSGQRNLKIIGGRSYEPGLRPKKVKLTKGKYITIEKSDPDLRTSFPQAFGPAEEISGGASAERYEEDTSCSHAPMDSPSAVCLLVMCSYSISSSKKSESTFLTSYIEATNTPAL
jgi:hypothetical protein